MVVSSPKPSELIEKSMAVFNGKGSADDGGGVGNVIKRFLSDLKSSSKTKQLTVGAVSGCVAGYLASKFGKVAASAVGGSLLIIQIAKYNGYIQVDWNKFNQDVEATKRALNKNKSKLPALVENVTTFTQENAVLAGGFASGFLLGFAYA